MEMMRRGEEINMLRATKRQKNKQDANNE
jgi:hypothetical protein